MGLSSPNFLRPPSRFGSLAQRDSASTYSLSVLSLLIALPISKELQSFGPMGTYFPVTLAVIVCAWYGGVGPALACEVFGAFVVFSFLVRPKLDSPVTPTQLYALLGFLVIGKLGLFLVAYIRWTRDLQTAVGKLKLLANSTNDAVWDWDVVSGRMSLTGNLDSLLGHPGPVLETTSDWWRGLRHLEDPHSASEDLDRILNSSTDVWGREYRLRKGDDSDVLVAARGTVLRDRAGKPVRMIGGLSDITAIREAQDRLAFEALHDPVTGLPNRRFFRERLQQTMAALTDEEFASAVLFLDLDRFKAVNDSFGHTVGDKLLRAFSKRVELSLAAGEIAARFGGDEFTVLLPNVHGPCEAMQIAERIQQALATPYELEGHTVVITASIGIALGWAGGQPEEVLRHADVAMYRAKARGRARSEIFESDLDAPRMNLVQLESEIRKGIAGGEFLLHYQPIVSLSSGEIAGVEALVRWQHPRRGLLLPVEFLPVAEESGLIRALGARVLETACADLRGWQTALPSARGVYVNVNLAERQFMDPDLAALVTSCLQRNDLDGSQLVLELTENIILGEGAEAAARMEPLRRAGVRFALDDFGKGHSSLARLDELPISILKVDCVFIRAISAGRPVLTDAIVALAHELSLDVTAECVETRGQVEHLSRVNCTAAQGKFFGLPMTRESLAALLRSRKRWLLDYGQSLGK